MRRPLCQQTPPLRGQRSVYARFVRHARGKSMNIPEGMRRLPLSNSPGWWERAVAYFYFRYNGWTCCSSCAASPHTRSLSFVCVRVCMSDIRKDDRSNRGSLHTVFSWEISSLPSPSRARISHVTSNIPTGARLADARHRRLIETTELLISMALQYAIASLRTVNILLSNPVALIFGAINIISLFNPRSFSLFVFFSAEKERKCFIARL